MIETSCIINLHRCVSPEIYTQVKKHCMPVLHHVVVSHYLNQNINKYEPSDVFNTQQAPVVLLSTTPSTPPTGPHKCYGAADGPNIPPKDDSTFTKRSAVDWRSKAITFNMASMLAA